MIVRITDTGVGIARESIPKVFGLFTQVHAGSSVRYGGLGIGLTAVVPRRRALMRT
jgi:signal transduction histidine kinase